MGIGGFFPQEPIQIRGKPDEKVVPSRVARSSTISTINNKMNLLLQKGTLIVNGDIITFRGSIWYATAHSKTAFGEGTQIFKCNDLMTHVRLVPKYVGTNKVGDTEQVVQSNVPINHWDITAQMRQYDLGLLSNTIKKVMVGQVGIQVKDRLKFDGKNYHVEGINDGKYEGLVELQISADNRPTVL